MHLSPQRNLQGNAARTEPCWKLNSQAVPSCCHTLTAGLAMAKLHECHLKVADDRCIRAAEQSYAIEFEGKAPPTKVRLEGIACLARPSSGLSD